MFRTTLPEPFARGVLSVDCSHEQSTFVSGRRESNPCSDLGRIPYCHYTTPAYARVCADWFFVSSRSFIVGASGICYFQSAEFMKLRSLIWLPAGFTAALAILGVRYLTFTSAATPFVPPEFAESRVKGAAIAAVIMDLSRTRLSRINEIAELDRNGKVNDALLIVTEELLQINRIRDEAARLASQLERMALAIPSIRPAEARELATEAVSNEVALVTRLMTHNAYLSELFDVLQIKFTDRRSNVDGRVNDLVNKINDEAKAINQFNRQFNESLRQFDARVSG